MYVLEIETRNKLKRIENPRKARILDLIFTDCLQIMDNDGKWHTICTGWIGGLRGQILIMQINDAIKRKENQIYIDL